MIVTQKDIAKSLNLSRSVVAGVLGNQAQTRVREETRRRILQRAAELNYRPNRAATALRTSRSGVATIAYVRPDAEWRPIYSGIAEPLAEALAQARSSLMIRVYATQEECLDGLKGLASERSADVVVLLGKPEDVVAQGELLDDLEVQFVVLGRFEDTHPNWIQIDYDHEQMVRRAVEHLASLGHRRIAYLGYQMDSPFCFHLLRGYRWAMNAVLGVDAPNELEGSVIPGLILGSLPGQMAKWWALPAEAQPTAIVIGTAQSLVWNAFEADLAKRGMELGYGPGKLAAAGLAADNLVLLNGSAHVYAGLGHIDYARLAAEQLLVPILNGQPLEHRIVRVTPELTPIQAYPSK